MQRLSFWRRGGIFIIFILTLTLALPIYAQGGGQSTPQRIESDDRRVERVGTWSKQTAAGASGGSYLFNAPAPTADPYENMFVIELVFKGAAIEVIYVAGPTLGTLAIEVDDTVLRTVITTADETAYQQSAKISYLTDEVHTLRVYAQAGGVIAVDAFIISPSLSLERGPGGEVAFLDEGGIQSSTCAPLNNIHRVSLTHTGAQASGSSLYASLSYDGRYVAFRSFAALLPADTDALNDVYVYDRLLCALQLVSVDSNGVKGNAFSGVPKISNNGRYIAFQSDATNLVLTDTNGFTDVFLHDRLLGTTVRVSVATGGTQANANVDLTAISGDGRYVAFQSEATNLVTGDTNGDYDAFVHDRQTSTTTRVSVATGGTQSVGGDSYSPSLSNDGRYVTFDSSATNLVAGDTNNLSDIFVHDRNTNTTTRVSVVTGGAQATGSGSFHGAISGDGRYVVFESMATNLVTGDTNGLFDIFVHDRNTTTTTRVSVATGGVQSSGGDSYDAALSYDGRYVTFWAVATNLVTGDTNAQYDVFVHDRNTTTTTRASVAADGTQISGGDAQNPAISGDGRYIGFHTLAPNLVNGDTNNFWDVFITPRVQPSDDTLALFSPAFEQVNLIDTLADSPPAEAYTALSLYAPPTTPAQWVMGDWNGDGLKTPGVYANGPFYYTNKLSEALPADWRSLWIGVAGAPVSGQFDDALPHDCIGAVQSANFPPFGLAFVLYYTCDLSGTAAPTISNQWLSVVLPDSGGFTGTHQFAAGDFDNDGDDSVAVRRGTTIAFGNVAPVDGSAAFDLAQYIGAPGTGSDGIIVIGDWDANGIDSFGLFYQNGEFFYRNDLLFNSGTYVNQTVGAPFGTSGIQATSWR